MTLHIKVGKVTSPAAVGQQTISGLGFRPKAIFFSSGSATETLSSPYYSVAWGLVTDTSRFSYSANAHNTTFTHLTSDTIPLSIRTSGRTQVATDVGFTDDGFTINWSSVSATAVDIPYMAFGGDELLNVKADWLPVAASLGPTVYSGFGFKPNFLMVMSQNENQSNSTFYRGFGVATAEAQWVESTGMYTTTTRSDFTLGSVGRMISYSGQVANEVSLQSFDDNGMTLNWKNRTYSGWGRSYYIAFEFKHPPAVGTLTQAATSGEQVLGDLSGIPKGLLFHSYGFPLASFMYSSTNLATGLADAENQYAIGRMRIPNVPASTHRENASLYFYGGTSIGSEAQAISTLDSAGFTLNWNPASADLREIGYAAFLEEPPVVVVHEGEFDWTAESATTLEASRKLQASVDLVAESSLQAQPQVVRAASIHTIGVDSAFTYTGSVLAERSYLLGSTSEAQYSAVKGLLADFSWSAEAKLDFTGEKIKESAYLFDAVSGMTFKTEGLVTSEFRWTAKSTSETTSEVDYISSYLITTQGGMSYTPRPRLYRTYEKVSGKMRVDLARGKQTARVRAVVQPLRRGKLS